MIRVKRMHLHLTREKILSAARPPAAREVTDICRQIYNRAIVLCPVDTGNLRTHHVMRVDRVTCRGQVFNDASYATAVHDGTRPHTITARRGRTLRFVAGGRVVYARQVRHPGTRPQPWLAMAAASVAAGTGVRWART